MSIGKGFQRGLDDEGIVTHLAQLMIRKGFITKEEFFEILKEVQAEHHPAQPTADRNAHSMTWMILPTACQLDLRTRTSKTMPMQTEESCALS